MKVVVAGGQRPAPNGSVPRIPRRRSPGRRAQPPAGKNSLARCDLGRRGARRVDEGAERCGCARQSRRPERELPLHAREPPPDPGLTHPLRARPGRGARLPSASPARLASIEHRDDLHASPRRPQRRSPRNRRDRVRCTGNLEVQHGRVHVLQANRAASQAPRRPPGAAAHRVHDEPRSRWRLRRDAVARAPRTPRDARQRPPVHLSRGFTIRTSSPARSG